MEVAHRKWIIKRLLRIPCHKIFVSVLLIILLFGILLSQGLELNEFLCVFAGRAVRQERKDPCLPFTCSTISLIVRSPALKVAISLFSVQVSGLEKQRNGNLSGSFWREP